MRRALSRVAWIWARSRPAMLETITAAIRKNTRVSTFWVSVTAKVQRGSVKKKLKAKKLATEVRMAGRNPARMATTSTPSR